MLVKAISQQVIDAEYCCIEIGDEIRGVARSYTQNFITIEQMYDNEQYVEGEIDENGYPENIQDAFKYRNIKVKVKVGSIKRLYCGCGSFAVREHGTEPLCMNCNYESPHFEEVDTGYHAMDYMRDWD
ncbi:UNVERIFIED_CONTAM: hypothetical protein POZ17_19600 [Ralstonia mannitolilytica]